MVSGSNGLLTGNTITISGTENQKVKSKCSLEGVSIYIHEPKGKVAEAYKKLTEEVLSHEN